MHASTDFPVSGGRCSCRLFHELTPDSERLMFWHENTVMDQYSWTKITSMFSTQYGTLWPPVVFAHISINPVSTYLLPGVDRTSWISSTTLRLSFRLADWILKGISFNLLSTCRQNCYRYIEFLLHFIN